MVIGNGMKAKRFMEYVINDAYIIFASGVSNSLETDSKSFQAEEEELITAIRENQNKTFVYFSSTSIYDMEMMDSPYTLHKLKMEEIVKSNCKLFLIFRVSQIVGISKSSNTIVNFLVNSINLNKEFNLWANAYRNIIDIDDVFFIVHHILSSGLIMNRIINIANPNNISVKSIAEEIEIFLEKKGNYQLVDKGNKYKIPIDDILPVISQLKLSFGEDYLTRILKKYFTILKGKNKTLSIVVPTYFEENGIVEFYKRTKNVLISLEPRFNHEIIFVNDGSTDGTMGKLLELQKSDSHVKIIDFARNFGNQFAITAGIDKAIGDAIVIIDDDLQDPPEVMLNLISKWEAGYDVVYGVRKKRKGVNIIFQIVAKLYYRVIDLISDVEIPVDTGDFRLIDNSVADTLRSMREESRYYRGLVAWTGFSQVGWYYERDSRFAGESTFTLSKYIRFGLSGITSFSDKPLYFSSYLGFIVTITGFLFVVWTIISKIIDPSVTIRGWTSLTAIIIFFGGIQLISIGVLGLYISKIFREVKKRPLYITKKEYGFVKVGKDNGR